MLAMSVNRWMVSLTLCFMCVSASDEQNKEDCCDQDMCETHELRAPLGSTVLLPCTFTYNISSVSWNQNGTDLIHFSDGYIEFRDPRDGRVSVYPNQQSEGNYSISIDELKLSDLGCYRCEHGHDCVQVELSLQQDTPKAVTLLICICSGVASIMLGVGCYCCMKYTMGCNKRTQYYVNNPASAVAVGFNDGHPLYENDEPANSTRNYSNLPGGLHFVHRNAPTQAFDLNLDHFNLVRTESQRTYVTVIE